MRQYIDLVEARSHANLNPKIPTVDVFKKYISLDNNDLFVHFHSIEKIGIRPVNTNTPDGSPMGVYAMPISVAVDYGMAQAKVRKSKYASILKLSAGSKLLNLSNTNIKTMQNVAQVAVEFYRKKLKDKTDIQIPTSVRDCFQLIISLLDSYARRRNRHSSALINSFFRKNGYDAIYDNQTIINDNQNQIVFLTVMAYEVVETIPIRF